MTPTPQAPRTPAGREKRWGRLLVLALATWLVVMSGLVLAATWKSPVRRAVVGMGWGLILLWIGGCGLTMWRWRESWCGFVARMRLPWMLKFVLGSTALALLEEAITTLLTNCAPLFGVRPGQAYITASANYLDVVLYHSVVVFVPMFVAWALMLRRWTFSAFEVFLLFGLTGTLAETSAFGLQHLGEFALWIFVYGLMVWLPAQWVPADRPASRPRWWLYPVAVVFPLLCVPLAAVLEPWIWLTPKHPPIHFPPITG
ncbi:MAG: hypothetical protein KGS61_20745 [Verrucomicrobia bacterium]|nr:hypothetical protein [Verrucomicrobiota bacterium]